MASIERRERTVKARGQKPRKVTAYRVKWRFKGVGAQQSLTCHAKVDAEDLKAYLEQHKHALFRDDPALVRFTGEAPSQEPEIAPLTLREVVEEWITRPGLSKASRKAYRTAAKRLGALGSRPVPDLTVADINAWFTAQEEAGLSPNYRRTMQIMVNGALTRAGRPGLTVEVRNTGGRKVRPYYLTRQQVDALVETARERGGDNLAAAIRLSATCGLRWGETFGLRVRYLDIPGRTVAVEEGINNTSKLEDGWQPVTLKTPTSIRMVPMPASLAKDLEPLTRGRRGDEPVFFPSGKVGLRKARFWTHRTFHYNWRVICRDTPGVPDDLRYHDLRHTAAKNWLEARPNPVPIGLVSRFLGHSKIDVTHREYGRFDQTSLDILRDAMGD